MATIMQLENVFRIYRMGQEKIAAVDGVSLDVQEGEILCLQGPSGSGKSTLLHMMAGLDRPSRGSIILGKAHIEKLSEDRLALFRQRHVGFIFQSYYLIPTLTALENVTLPLMFAGISKSKRNKAGKELLAAVGLKDRMRHKPSEMSGGQQQRVSIARAFANNPRIVFADEPTGNLDTHTTYEMMNLMTRLAKERNHTLVIVTHDLEISGYATRLVKVKDMTAVSKVFEDIKALGYEAYSPIQMIDEMKKQSAGLRQILGGIGAMALLIAAIGITNTMYMSIYERTREIGIIKVIGARLSDIRRLFMVEAAWIGIFGGITGVLFSGAASFFLNNSNINIMGGNQMWGPDGVTRLPISYIPLWLMAAAFGFAITAALAAGFFPARRAMRLSVMKALRQD